MRDTSDIKSPIHDSLPAARQAAGGFCACFPGPTA
jgi:hypothetical protein